MLKPAGVPGAEGSGWAGAGSEGEFGWAGRWHGSPGFVPESSLAESDGGPCCGSTSGNLRGPLPGSRDLLNSLLPPWDP